MPTRPVCRSWKVTNQTVLSVVPPWADTGNCVWRKAFPHQRHLNICRQKATERLQRFGKHIEKGKTTFSQQRFQKKKKTVWNQKVEIMTPDTSGVTTQTHKRMPGCLAPSPTMAERSQRELQKDGKPLGTKEKLSWETDGRASCLLHPQPMPAPASCCLNPSCLLALSCCCREQGFFSGLPLAHLGSPHQGSHQHPGIRESEKD